MAGCSKCRYAEQGCAKCGKKKKRRRPAAELVLVAPQAAAPPPLRGGLVLAMGPQFVLLHLVTLGLCATRKRALAGFSRRPHEVFWPEPPTFPRARGAGTPARAEAPPGTRS